VCRKPDFGGGMATSRQHEQGFGCMGMSAFYTTARTIPEQDKINVFQEAVRCGVTLFNSATFYGPLNEEGYGDNLRLIRKCLEGVDRSKIQLMVKVGMDTRCPVEKTGTSWINRADREGLIADVNFALEQLGVDYIDIVVLCRVSATVPIEESVAALQSIVDEGKARFIGLSEASAGIIRRAQSITPIYCIEQEWSLWTRDIEETILPTCRELGIKIVAYSPLGQGFLAGHFSDLQNGFMDTSDWRNSLPRLQPGNVESNRLMVQGLEEFAKRKQWTIGQLSLAWLHAQGADVIPIPGTTNMNHLHQNLAARELVLTDEEMNEIKNILESHDVKGDRYPNMALTFRANE
jgi:aryl-alcohol dehydrogenase-like predicted oxidoreductase